MSKHSFEDVGEARSSSLQFHCHFASSFQSHFIVTTTCLSFSPPGFFFFWGKRLNYCLSASPWILSPDYCTMNNPLNRNHTRERRWDYSNCRERFNRDHTIRHQRAQLHRLRRFSFINPTHHPTTHLTPYHLLLFIYCLLRSWVLSPLYWAPRHFHYTSFPSCVILALLSFSQSVLLCI